MNKSYDFRGHVAEAVKTLQIYQDDFYLISLYKYGDIIDNLKYQAREKRSPYFYSVYLRKVNDQNQATERTV